jgi:excisionase family DNA binding protein
MTQHADDRARDMPPPIRATIEEAARLLGVSENAVRKRIERGTLRSIKADGTRYVLLDDDMPRHADDEPEDMSVNVAALFDSLQAQIELLREQLVEERAANRENRRLLAAALERIPAIEQPPDTPSAPRESPETVSEEEYDAAVPYVRRGPSESPSQDPQPEPRESSAAASDAPGPVGSTLEEESSQRSWWRKLFWG